MDHKFKVGDIVYYQYMPQNPGKIRRFAPSETRLHGKEAQGIVEVEWLKPRLMNGSATKDSRHEKPRYEKVTAQHHSWIKSLTGLVDGLEVKVSRHKKRIKEAEGM